MAEETQRNTVATVGMVFSIIGLIALVTIIFARLGLPLLFVGFVLGIIGLFFKPRGKARVAICIPLVVFIAIFSVIAYVWNSVKTPANEFMDWAKIEFENIDEETFDGDKFSNIANEEFNNIFSSMSEEDFTALIENSTGSNILEKGSYALVGILQQGLESSLEKYNSGYLPEISDENEGIVTVDVENNEDENTEEPENIEENSEEENVEVFTQSEQDDIEQILDILE